MILLDLDHHLHSRDRQLAQSLDLPLGLVLSGKRTESSLVVAEARFSTMNCIVRSISMARRITRDPFIGMPANECAAALSA